MCLHYGASSCWERTVAGSAISSFKAPYESALSEGGQNLRTGQAALARRAFEEARRFDPEALEPLVGLAQAAVLAGDRAAALGHFEQALASPSRSLAQRVDVLVAQTAALVRFGDLRGAIRTAERAIALDPSCAAAANNRDAACALALGFEGVYTLAEGGLLQRV
jgi:tetratricopeptide (TPR) repeat protein